MTQRYLHGIHDEGAESLHGDKPGWTLITEQIGLNPQAPGRDYRHISNRGIGVIVRLNHAYGSGGTIPLPAKYPEFAAACASWAARSQGVEWYIIGNEPNHEGERPQGVIIPPEDYARCFALCRNAIKQANPQVKVMHAAMAPYHAQPTNWLTYLKTVLTILGPQGCDGIDIHAYARSMNPADITSRATMGGELGDQYSGFYTYRDVLTQAVPLAMTTLPAFITEFDVYGDWLDQNTGVIQAMYADVDGWNNTAGTQQIMAALCFRWLGPPEADNTHDWEMRNKPQLLQDFRAAVAKGYKLPAIGVTNVPETNLPYVPNESTPTEPTPVGEAPPREISEDFKRRVPQIELAPDTYAKPYYRLIRAEYVPNGAQRFGPDHHILVEVLDKDGKRKMGVPVTFFWETAEVSVPTNKTSGPYAVDYGMTNHGNSYGVLVGDRPEDESDLVFGMGLGTIEQPDWNHHVTYYLVFQEVMPQAQPKPPTEQPLPASAIGYITAPNGLHLRRLPDSKSDSLKIVGFGEAVRITAVANIKGWVRARYGNQEGWMSSEYITLTPPVHEVPAEPSQPTPEPVTPGSERDNWTRSIAFVRRWEGSWADDPNDSGGATMAGITIGTYTRWREAHGQPTPTKADLRNITEQEINQIYYEWYWLASQANALPWPLCLAQMDTAVNAGVGRAKEMLAKSNGNFDAYVGHVGIWYTTLNGFEHFGRAWARRRFEILLEASK